MSRVQLKNIPALKFQEGSYTSARRSTPIPQLTCIGKACDSYRPEVVRCVNLGGSGDNVNGQEVDVDWKCEADLPEALRFGRVEVSCEGWSRPGDPYVMKESCGLEYRLVEIPGNYRRDPNEYSSHRKSSVAPEVTDPVAYLFYLIFVAVVCYMLYSVCAGPRDGRRLGQNGAGGRWGGGGGGGGGGTDYGSAPPPPYSKHPESPSEPQSQSWRPGFTTGAMAGAAATHLYNTYNSRSDDRAPRAANTAQAAPRFDRWSSLSDDRGEGSSGMGATRRATGMGGSSVR